MVMLVMSKKHLIDIVEGIIKAKGITEIVIVPTEDKYNVMVKVDKKLTDAQANMIQKISPIFAVNPLISKEI